MCFLYRSLPIPSGVLCGFPLIKWTTTYGTIGERTTTRLFDGPLATSDGGKTVGTFGKRLLREELLHPLLSPVSLKHTK